MIEPAQVLRLLQTLRDLDDEDQVLEQEDRDTMDELLVILEAPVQRDDNYTDEGGEA